MSHKVARVLTWGWPLFLAIALNVRGYAQAQENRAEAVELVRRSLAYLETMRRVSLEARSEYWFQNYGKPRTTGVEKARYIRFDAWAEVVSELRAQGAGPMAANARQVSTPTSFVSIPGAPGMVPTSIVWGGPRAVARHAALSRASSHGAHLDGCPALVLLGENLRTLVPTLRKLPTERVRGVECEVVEGESPYGDFRIWIAPERHFRQCRWRLVQRPEHFDLSGQRLVGDLPPWETESGPVRIASWTTEVEVTEFASVGEALIPSAGRERMIIRGHNGSTLQEGESIRRRSNIKLLTDFAQVEQAFAVDVPDGTYVTNLDDPSGVQYEWRRGQVVRRHTQFSGAARGQWHPRSMWVYVAWTVLALAVAGGALRVWHARRAKAPQ